MYLQHWHPWVPSLAARTAAVLIGLACASLARADDTGFRPHWLLSGFASVGVVYSDYAEGDYSASVLKASGAGHSRRWSGDVDSRLGARLSTTLDRQWSAVLQVISEQRPDNSYTPIVEWANVKQGQAEKRDAAVLRAHRELADNPNDQAIAMAVISLGHKLNLRVIAEGVETEQQCDFLRENDCDEMQGYLFSPPLPADEVAAILLAQQRRQATQPVAHDVASA